jgi:hypothetical protein
LLTIAADLIWLAPSRRGRNVKDETLLALQAELRQLTHDYQVALRGEAGKLTADDLKELRNRQRALQDVVDRMERRNAQGT